MNQHLLRVTRPVVEFESLVAAARHQELRLGWLELSRAAPVPLPESLAAAADAGVLRAVAIGGGRCVAVKPMRGSPVLRDVLRENFRGCSLVLVTGEIEAPLLEPSGEDWALTLGDGEAVHWTTEKLVGALRKHRPFAHLKVD